MFRIIRQHIVYYFTHPPGGGKEPTLLYSVFASCVDIGLRNRSPPSGARHAPVLIPTHPAYATKYAFPLSYANFSPFPGSRYDIKMYIYKASGCTYTATECFQLTPATEKP